ncbi:MAG: asparagine synthase (glutamine-hydrolyzing) [Planctomycetota bacterium]|nr:asparagine synthase (glutamine-hydrolyzing) [Planctomycetota bacterium]
MCGIVGLLRWDGLAPEDGERVTRGARALRHRGPDGDGFWSDEHCALGFRRLKVIDLSPAGDQPMANETGSLHVVFNGEIYNFRDLRGQLEALGHTFRSQSDTEVLLHGYEAWGGEELLGKLRGMFAFALWDAPNRRLFLARDPLGVKPLYFAERKGCILFASEPKALFATGLVEAKLDPAALHEALTYRYVPAPRSGFRDVEKLPAGNLAIAEKGELRYRAWWRLDTGTKAEDPSHLADRITTPVQRRLVSDVPLGAWLSGGIDSGLVLSMMGEGVRTFSAGFAHPEWDERDLAHATARHLKATHRDFEAPADIFKLLPQIVWHADEPYFDSSCLPTYVLAEKTKPHATVVLSGDGGDESFGGYERYVGIAQFYKKWKKMPGWLTRLQLRYAKWRRPAPSRSGWDRLVRWLDKCAQQEAAGFHPYLGAVTLFEQDQIRALYAEDLLEVNQELDGREYVALALRKATKDRYPECPPDEHKLDTGLLQRADLATYLPGDVLHKVDRMSMAHGLEVRSPFLDVDLVNLALSMPDDVRLPARETKPLLRRLAEKRLPSEVVHARKRGFGVPLDDWFRGPLKTLAADLFESSHLVTDNVFKPKYWEPFWKDHQEARANHGERLYALLALELWHRTFLSGSPATERPAPL